jgi:alanine dehydrogenase
MKIGVPKEIKDKENRVALTPDGAVRLVSIGHEVWVEYGAGLGAGFNDVSFETAGAHLGDASEIWDSDMVVKVKEPLEQEYSLLGQQIVFTFFHLAGAPIQLTKTLLKRGTTAVAYETLEDEEGRLPLLAPMSAIAGNMAALEGAYYLSKTQGGRGVQVGAVLGCRHGNVMVIGDGVVAYHAAKSAWGLGAENVQVAYLSELRRGVFLQEISPSLDCFPSTQLAIAERIRDSDILIGAVLKHGAKADYVISESMVQTMMPGSVIVDVSIDQGGCVETSRATSHSDPVFEKHGVIHYCVTNMPGAYPRTSTLALTQATLPYIVELAERGLDAMRFHSGLRRALNVSEGRINYRSIAESLDLLDFYRDFS